MTGTSCSGTSRATYHERSSTRALCALAMVVIGLAVLAGPAGLVGTASAATDVTGCTTIDSPGTYELTGDVTNSTASSCIHVTSSDVVLDGQGHTIDGVDGASDSAGVYVDGTSAQSGLENVTVRDVTAVNWHYGVWTNRLDTHGTVEGVNASSNVYSGVYLINSGFTVDDENVVRDVTAVRNDMYGITLSASPTQVTRVNASSNGEDGVRISGGNAQDSTVSHSTVSGNDQYGIHVLSGASNVTMTNVTATGNGDGIVVDGADSATLQRSLIETSDDDGIEVTDSADVTIQDNTVGGNVESGIRINRSDRATLAANTVIGNNQGGGPPNAGVFIDDSNDVTVEDQVVRNNRLVGVRIWQANGIEVRDSRITENCGGTYGVHLLDTDVATFVGNNVSNNTGTGFSITNSGAVSGSEDVVLRDTMVNDNGQDGIQINAPGVSVRNASIANNSQDGVTVSAQGNGTLFADSSIHSHQRVRLNGATVGLDTVDFGSATLSGTARNAYIEEVTFDLTPPSSEDVAVGSFNTRYLDSEGYLDVSFEYEDSPAVTESSLSIWEEDTQWSEHLGDTHDTTANTISKNLTLPAELGQLTYAVFGIANEPPTADFTASPSGPTEGESVSFDASMSDDPDDASVSYQWDFGDGSTASGETTSHTYGSAGTYTVELAVTDEEGAASTVSKTVTVQADTAGGGGGGGSNPNPPGDADLGIGDVTLSEEAIEPGDTVTISVEVTNGGDEGGTREVELDVGDREVGSTNVYVSGGGSRTITFEHTFSDEGEYDIVVENSSVGTVNAAPAATPTATESPTPTASPTPTDTPTPGGAPETPAPDDSGLPLLPIVAVLVVVAIGAGAVWWSRQ